MTLLTFLLLILVPHLSAACFRWNSYVPSTQALSSDASLYPQDMVVIVDRKDASIKVPKGIKVISEDQDMNRSLATKSARYEPNKIWQPIWSRWTDCLPELGCIQIRHLNWVAIPIDQFNKTKFKDALNGKKKEYRPCDRMQLITCNQILGEAKHLVSQIGNRCGDRVKKQDNYFRSKRIIGGGVTGERTWPWLVSNMRIIGRNTQILEYEISYPVT
ncbi:hypothetical protein Ciccas_007366 [Cichlidogyrus casuarinus]|uniref:Uncharacterized protein n=1 Tax=Cichlidogyrus casuarinus TaxID=1844966 RepID=A0ABD2Q3Q8_9PLAT